jgi:hypothetical protein
MEFLGEQRDALVAALAACDSCCESDGVRATFVRGLPDQIKFRFEETGNRLAWAENLVVACVENTNGLIKLLTRVFATGGDTPAVREVFRLADGVSLPGSLPLFSRTRAEAILLAGGVEPGRVNAAFAASFPSSKETPVDDSGLPRELRRSPARWALDALSLLGPGEAERSVAFLGALCPALPEGPKRQMYALLGEICLDHRLALPHCGEGDTPVDAPAAHLLIDIQEGTEDGRGVRTYPVNVYILLGAGVDGPLRHHGVGTDRFRNLVLSLDQIRARLPEWVAAADEVSDGAEPVVHFFVPGDLLTADFDEWQASEDARDLLGGAYPVLVRLQGRGTKLARLRRKHAAVRERRSLRPALDADEIVYVPPADELDSQLDVVSPGSLVVFREPPTPDLLSEVADALRRRGGPYAIWPRAAPDGPAADMILAPIIHHDPFTELPRQLRRFRLHNHAARLSLLWEDPALLPPTPPLLIGPTAGGLLPPG